MFNEGDEEEDNDIDFTDSNDPEGRDAVKDFSDSELDSLKDDETKFSPLPSSEKRESQDSFKRRSHDRPP